MEAIHVSLFPGIGGGEEEINVIFLSYLSLIVTLFASISPMFLIFMV